MYSEENKAVIRLVISATSFVTIGIYLLLEWKYYIALLMTSAILCMLFLILYLFMKHFSYHVLHYTLISLSIQLLTVLIIIMIDVHNTY